MNRTLKEAQVLRCATHDELRVHPGTFLEAHDFAKQLKTL
jgi:hypothetical protein